MSSLNEVDLSQTPEVPVEVEAPKEEEKKEEEKKEEEKKEETIRDVLSAYDGSPDGVTIEQWKQQHGEVLCAGLSPTELFVFRPITRSEFTNLQAFVQSSREPVSQFDIESKIVDTCVLWASPPALASLEQKAGTLTTVHEQILQASNFVNPAYAGNLVMKL